VVPERVHGLRLDLQVGPGDHGRRHPSARHRRRLPQPPAQHLHADGPARVRDRRRGLGRGALPAADLPRRAPPPARGAEAPGRRRAAAAATRVGRLDPQPREADLLPAPRAAAARCCRTSRGSTCRRATRTAPPATTRSRRSTVPVASATAP
jgi:hypothetical protein